ncbi:hypothetical protein [Sutcliffiella rhizosphaerae]|uniref:DUF4825 domain-containing protein n=1 Tax=Sutcliffiella rhizosphaerae TaxID=2880967 RepID=A0ABN8ABI8_9BACI|nr:hypothetical protein [Sutcliffiella rhizosphaerae]CAG9621551.1 hypothetical protein BACCIP111883_02324 [Sutcliffiella rhizosphaerae]
MKYISIKVFLVVFVILLLACSNSHTTKTMDEMPKDFNFSLDYSTYGKQKIDTFNGIIVKDLIKDGTIEAKITLTQAEKKQILDEMVRINIMAVDKYEYQFSCMSEPPSYSKWHIQINGETQDISFCNSTKDVLELIKLQDFIHTIVSSREEYQDLPEANGWYE